MSNEHDRSERALEQLFAHAQPRPMPPAADTEDIRRAIYAEWDAVTGRRVWLRRAGAAAAAAAALAFVVWTTVGVNPPQAPPALARVERVQGVVGMRLGDELTVGATVVTGGGQLALRLANGGSLRLGRETRLELTGDNAAHLVAGMVYFDSEDARAAEPFTVTTELGAVRDIGTQFMVRADSEQLEVGVRDGRIALTRGADEADAGAGEKLAVAAATSDIRRDSMASFGEEWAWAERLAPPFDIDGRRLEEFLTWFEQQTGRSIVFADAEAERVARETELNGSIDLEPMAKLEAVLTLTDLDYSLERERVLITSQ